MQPLAECPERSALGVVLACHSADIKWRVLALGRLSCRHWADCPAGVRLTVQAQNNIFRQKNQGQTSPLYMPSEKEKVLAVSHRAPCCPPLWVSQSLFVVGRCQGSQKIYGGLHVNHLEGEAELGTQRFCKDLVLSPRQDHRAVRFHRPQPSLGQGNCPEASGAFCSQTPLGKCQSPGKYQEHRCIMEIGEGSIGWTGDLRWCSAHHLRTV